MLPPQNDCASMTSIMLSVKVNKSDPTDLYEQVAAEIRRAIADGEANPGERLPPAKDLAAVLGVNTNTVLRSLRLLRDEGLLEFRRGRGISVQGRRSVGPSSSERGTSSSSPAARATAWTSWSRSSRTSAEDSPRPERPQRNSLFASMSNHMANSVICKPAMKSTATRTIVGVVISFPPSRRTTSISPSRKPATVISRPNA